MSFSDDISLLARNRLARKAAIEAGVSRIKEWAGNYLAQRRPRGSHETSQDRFGTLAERAASRFTHTALLDGPIDASVLEAHRRWIFHCARLALQHRFDLGGSEWIHLSQHSRPPGFLGIRYGDRPKDRIAQLIASSKRGTSSPVPVTASRIGPIGTSKTYAPIPWNRDPYTGFKWDVSQESAGGHVFFLPRPDPRMVWEVGRLQHLPLLALAYMAASSDSSDASGASFDVEAGLKRQLVAEFFAQLKDFVDSNPVGFGIHWASGMEVGIRLANVALALSLFSAAGAELSGNDLVTAFSMLADHIEFCVTHPDRRRFLTHNHFLVQLCGMVVGSVLFDEDLDSEDFHPSKVLRTAGEELCQQVIDQFQDDGSNFEGSTGYHLFAAGAAAFGLAVVRRRVPDTPNLQPAIEKLGRAGEFLDAVLDDFDRIPLIGDFDGGHFFVLERRTSAETGWVWDRAYALGTLGAIGSLCGVSFELHPHASRSLDACVVAAIGGKGSGIRAHPRASPGMAPLNIASESSASLSVHRVRRRDSRQSTTYWPLVRLLARGWDRAPSESRRMWLFAQDGRSAFFGAGTVSGNPPCSAADLLDILARSTASPAVYRYPRFGLYVYRGQGLYAVARCGPPGQRGWAGHSHADQLSVVLQLGDSRFLDDPGSFVYGASPELRRAYRSAKAHNGPYAFGIESLIQSSSLFGAASAEEGTCLSSFPSVFCGKWGSKKAIFWRIAIFAAGHVVEEGCSLLWRKSLGSKSPTESGPRPTPQWTVAILDWSEGAPLAGHSHLPVSRAYGHLQFPDSSSGSCRLT